MNVRSKNTNSRLGRRAWLTAAQMDEKFGAQVAALMRERKETNEELRATEIRENAELPGLKAGHLDLFEHASLAGAPEVSLLGGRGGA